ncbi:hypothetical protein A3736_15100 [Erythrobacter sp. HI0063]|uniref:hypothetical protein n=1 Tax=Erythrobacter sp. HI0063 TaxID=1822240 RepID=UPI0007C395C8|nr:hypothetical protein [Erythrobacter sp. HI0063]KZY58248.1 hypothetical protein A3736_15100 [Erythrobacter sp. HI0063]
MPDPGTLYDPATVAIALGALAGLFAANEWRKVWSSIDTTGHEVKGLRQSDLKDAALLTALALFLACGGYLFGEIVGRI